MSDAFTYTHIMRTGLTLYEIRSLKNDRPFSQQYLVSPPFPMLFCVSSGTVSSAIIQNFHNHHTWGHTWWSRCDSVRWSLPKVTSGHVRWGLRTCYINEIKWCGRSPLSSLRRFGWLGSLAWELKDPYRGVHFSHRDPVFGGSSKSPQGHTSSREKHSLVFQV